MQNIKNICTIQFHLEIKYFYKAMGKNIGKIRTKNLKVKYSQKLLDHVKQSATDAVLLQKE